MVVGIITEDGSGYANLSSDDSLTVVPSSMQSTWHIVYKVKGERGHLHTTQMASSAGYAEHAFRQNMRNNHWTESDYRVIRVAPFKEGDMK